LFGARVLPTPKAAVFPTGSPKGVAGVPGCSWGAAKLRGHLGAIAQPGGREKGGGGGKKRGCFGLGGGRAEGPPGRARGSATRGGPGGGQVGAWGRGAGFSGEFCLGLGFRGEKKTKKHLDQPGK